MASPEQIRAWVAQLEGDYENLCFTYRSRMRRPVIRIAEEKDRWGHWDPLTRTLTLALRLVETRPWVVVLEILKHEMAHQWVSEKDYSDEGHGPLFHEACRRFGVAPWARRAVMDPASPLEAWAAGAIDPETARLQNRVEKLLALAQSTNQHEAAAAMQKVQELYARYNLENETPAKEPDFVSREINTGKKRVERHHFLIASLLNDHFFVRVVHTSRYHVPAAAELKVIELLGRRANVDMAEYVYHFLWNQIHLRWKLHREETGAPARGKSSYFLGILTEFRKKLEEGEKRTGTVALVVTKDPHLRDFVRTRYPRLVSFSRGKGLSDPDSFKAGQHEGRKLTLHRPIHAAQSFLGRLLTR